MPAIPRPTRLLVTLLVLSTALRLWFAWDFLGFVTGDDVEVLETAFRSAFGLEYEPLSIRSLLMPEVVVRPFLEAGGVLGVTSPATNVRLALLPFVLLGTLSLWLVYRLGELWIGDSRIALLAAALYAVHPVFLAYSTTALPRGPAVTAIVGAAVLVSGERRGGLRGVAAGALLAFAFACRYSEVVFLAPLGILAWMAAQSRKDSAVRVGGLIAGFTGGVVMAVGWFDLATWGAPFASLVEFARYTLVERRASAEMVAQPIHWYLLRLPQWLPLSLLPLLFFVPGRRRGGSRELATGWLFPAMSLLILSMIHHKDLRYVQAMLPFLAVLTAAGGRALYRLGRRRTVIVLLLLATVWGLYSGARHLNRRSLSAVEAVRQLADEGVGAVAVSQAWAWGDRLFLGNEVSLLDVSLPPDVEGLGGRIAGTEWVGLYRENLEKDPELREVLELGGFRRDRDLARLESKPVVLYRRTSR